MKRERNQEAKKQRTEHHGQRIKEKRNNYKEQEVIEKEKESRWVQGTSQAVKGGNNNTKIRMSSDQYGRRNWAYLCELEGVWRHRPGQENMKEAEMPEKGREFGRVSLLSARKGDGSPGFCVCVLCTFSTWSAPTRKWRSRQLCQLRTWKSGIRPKKELKGRKKSQCLFFFSLSASWCLSYRIWRYYWRNANRIMFLKNVGIHLIHISFTFVLTFCMLPFCLIANLLSLSSIYMSVC